MSIAFATAAERQRTDSWTHLIALLRGYAGRALVNLRIRFKASHAERRMELLETLNLGGKRQLMLVQCDGQRYLVGLGSDSVQSIATAAPVPCSGTDDVDCSPGLQR
jgi:flagellar biogenesis protein FliO